MRMDALTKELVFPVVSWFVNVFMWTFSRELKKLPSHSVNTEQIANRFLTNWAIRKACHLLVDVSYPHNALFTVTPSKCLRLSAKVPLRGEGLLTMCTLPLEHWPLVMSKATQGRGSQALLCVEIIWGGGKNIYFLLPRRLSDKESSCQCKRSRFLPWIGKISWRRKWQPTLVLVPGKSHGQNTLAG